MFNRTFPPTGAGGGPFQWWSTFTNKVATWIVDQLILNIANQDVRLKRTAAKTLTIDDNAGGPITIDLEALVEILNSNGAAQGAVLSIGSAYTNQPGANSGSSVLYVAGNGLVGNNRNGRIYMVNPKTPAAVSDEAGRFVFFNPINHAVEFTGQITARLSGAGGVNGFGGTIGFYTKVDNGTLLQRFALTDEGSLIPQSSTGGIAAGLSNFAGRPVTPVEGMVYNFTDSTVNAFGAVIAGGGANRVSGRWNGAAWTVTGV